MFKEDETQYCPECEKWAEKYEQLAQKCNKVLELSKKYVDSAEYCLKKDEDIITKFKNEKERYYLKTLEQERQIDELVHKNEELKHALEEIKKINKKCYDWVFYSRMQDAELRLMGFVIAIREKIDEVLK